MSPFEGVLLVLLTHGAALACIYRITRGYWPHVHRAMSGLDGTTCIYFCCRTCKAIVPGGLSTRK